MKTRTSPSLPHDEFFPSAPAHTLRRRLERVRSDLAELVRYGPVIQNMVVQELRVRYQRSFLGFFWSLLNPVLMMTTMAVVFSKLMSPGGRWQDYVIYLFAGQLPWIFFANALTESAFSIIANEGLIRKIYVPKTIFPLSRVLFNLVNFLLSMVALFSFLIPLGARPSWAMLFLPVSIALFTAFTLGLGLMLAALNTFYRDCSHLVGVFLQAWYFITPIIYYPERFGTPPWFLRLNPAVPFISQFQSIIRYGQWPAAGVVACSLVLALASLGAGYAAFKAHEDKLVFRL